MSNKSVTSLKINFHESEIKTKWIWFVILGLSLISLGIVAFGNLVLASSASVLYVGAFMSLGGVVQMVHSFRLKLWPGFFYLFLSGLIYTFAGVIAFIDPALAAITLTLALSVALLTSGLLRIWSSFELKSSANWGWLFLSGLTTLIAGAIFAIGWPVNTIWILGLMLAFDLTLQGIYALVLGMGLRSVNYN